MSIRKLKQKVAVALIAAMSVSNVLSAAAATTGKPSTKSAMVEVTFDGNGGSWPTSIASKSTATKSNAAAGTVEEKEKSTKITRTYLVDEEEKDESGYYISLGLSQEYSRGKDWDQVTKEGYQRIAWFDGVDYLTNDSKKNLYNGAVLEAVWQAENTAPNVDPEIEDVLGKNPVIVTDGLGADEQLVLEAIPTEKDKECKAELEKVLQKHNIDLVGKLENAIGIELSVQKNNQNVNMVGKKVEITLPVPETLELTDTDKKENVKIKAIHFKENGEPEVFSVKLNDSGKFMTLVVENGFSPFYFVKTKEAEKTTVKIANVKNGYILAWTQEQNQETKKNERTYFPLGEEVSLEAGTIIYLQPYGYGEVSDYAEGWTGRLEALEVVNADGKVVEELKPDENIYSSYINYNQVEYEVKESCTIQAEFSRWAPEPKEDEENNTNPRSEFYISVRPNRTAGNRYSGRITVEKWNAETKKYEDISDYTIRIATEKEITDNDKLTEYQVEQYKRGIANFVYENNVLRSKGTLEEESYEIPFVITYEGKEYFLKNENSLYSAWIYLGEENEEQFGLYFALVRYNKKYDNSSNYGGNYLFTSYFSVTQNMNWESVKKPLFEGLANQYNGKPKMYNYPILSWQDENGKELKDSDLVGADNRRFYTLFKKEDGTAYCVDADYDDGPLTEGTHTIEVKNVDNGVIIAYTEIGDEVTYIPLGEKVTFPENTRIRLYAQGYEMTEDGKDWEGKLTSLKLVSGETEKDIANGDNYYIIKLNKDYTVEATFIKTTEMQRKRSKFNFYTDRATVAGKYSSTVELGILAEENSYKYQKLDPSEYTLRIANEEDFFKAGLSSERYDGDLFTYENGILSSKDELALDYYEVPFVITYQGQDLLYNEVYEVAYSAGISIGATNSFYHGVVRLNDQYETDNGTYHIGQVRFEKDGKENWGMVEALLDSSKTPQMYGYKFVGWQNYKGEAYKADSALVSESENSSYYDAFDMFVKADDETTPYKAPKATIDGQKPLEPSNPENPGGNDGNGGNGSGSGSGGSGGSGGSRRRVVGGSSGNSYTMTGNWVAGENGWRFLKSSGEYAANTWGWINNQYYYFDAQGNMATGWQFINGYWYYLNPAEGSQQGIMVVGVIYDPVYNAYFYTNSSGAMVTGWYQVNQNWYYFNPISDGKQGALLADTYIDGYYVGADGAWIPAN